MRLSEGAPKALVFQGSYMNSYGCKFFENAFSKYIMVHDYQNVIDFPYYYNIFQPDCVIFEVAEYVFNDTYFNYEKMMSINYNPAINTVLNYKTINVSKDDLEVETNGNLTTITWHTDNLHNFVWFESDKIYDMFYTENSYNVTIDTQNYVEKTIYNIYILQG